MKSNYYYGTPDGDEELVLDILSNSDVKSFKTSSIPLTEFWISKNAQLCQDLLDKIADGDNFESAKKCFEYPVYATKNGKNIGRPSMTDLMILTKKYTIAVEGKFTEDLYETIEEWKYGLSIKSEKPDVLKSWYEYIKPFCDFAESDISAIENKVVYQFLHRTASACKCSIDENKQPVVLYQLFYDKQDTKSKEHQKEVAEKLEEFKKLLRFKDEKIKLQVVLTPITNFETIKEQYFWAKADMFTLMKKKRIYEFGESSLFSNKKILLKIG